MESARFYDLSYLKRGTALQRKSYDLIRNHGIMEALQDFNPVLIGTIPIDIAVWNSDLDIACEVYDLDKFERKCHENFEKHNGYSFKVGTMRGIEVGIANFKIDGMLFEVYGEGRPVAEQYGFRHLLIESQLLETFGEEFKQQIIELKSQGLKTEPAFAKLLKIQGDPYEGLLNYNIESMLEIKSPEIREVNIIRYIQPFREGGSLPGLVDADDGFSYVIKFRGAGQGKKALVAEFIGGELARFLGLRVPEMVYADLDVGFGRTEPDEEIQDLLKFSVGKNLGVSYLNGAITFDANVDEISSEEASKIVWLDALLMNVDRTVKNTNMLIWHKELWLIDHGAALYFHHNWDNWEETVDKPFVQIKDHVLLAKAKDVAQIDATYKELFNKENIRKILKVIPDEWLIDEVRNLSADEVREVYVEFISRRASHSEIFVNQIQHAG